MTIVNYCVLLFHFVSMINDDTMVGKGRVMDGMRWSILIGVMCISVHSVYGINWIDCHNKTDGELFVTINFHQAQDPLWRETFYDPNVSWPQERKLLSGGRYRFGARPRTIFGKPCIKKLEVKKLTGHHVGSRVEYDIPGSKTCLGDLIIDVVDSPENGSIMLQEKNGHDRPLVIEKDVEDCSSCSIR